MRETTFTFIRDARRAKKAGADAIRERQRPRLAEMVAHARTASPLYRDLYAGLPERVDDVSALPVTSKQTLMAGFDAWSSDREITLARAQEFLGDPARIGSWFLEKYTLLTTSGTTGTRGIFVVDSRTMAVTSAMAVRALTDWLGFSDVVRLVGARGRMAMVMAVGGHVASAVAAARLRARRGKRVEALSVHMPLSELVARLNDFQPALLAPYASVGALLATEQEEGRLNIKPVLITLSAEGLSEGEIGRIARAFKARVGNSYAATEVMFLSYSCEHDWLHVNADWVIFEAVDAEHRPVPPGEPSHTILVTNLANRVQPILRYDLGDSVVVRPDPCPCGNPLPALRVQGRASDVLTIPAGDGRSVRIAPLSFAVLIDRIDGIELSQVIQTAPTTLRIRLRLEPGADADAVWREVETALAEMLRANRLKNVVVERGDEEPERTPGGKYRAVTPLR